MLIYRQLTFVFLAVILLIIAAANLGIAPELFDPVYELPFGDKAGHFFLMGLLSLLISLGFSLARVRVLSLRLLRNTLLLAALVTLEEFSQIFLDNRSFSLLDLSANYAGIFFFGELGALLRRFMNRRFDP
jgi:VanZ family protein